VADALQSILTEVGLAIAPLRAINTPERAVVFFRQLGYEIPPGAFGGALPQLGSAAGELIAAVRQLTQATDEAEVAGAIVNALARVGAAVDAIRQLHGQVQGGGGGGIPGIGDLPRRLTDFLVLDYCNTQRAELHEALHLLGLIEHNPAPAPGQSMRLINWDRLGQFLTEPQKIADDVYRWNSDFDTGQFLARLERLMRAAVLPGGLYPQADTTRTLLGNTSPDLQELRFPILQKGFTSETYSQFGITVSPAEAQGGKKKGIALLPFIMGAAEFNFAVCDRGELIFKSTADVKGVGLVIRPPFNAEGILNLTGAFQASIQVREKPDRAEEIILIGSRGGSRLAIQGLGIKWFAQNPQGKLDLGFEGEIQALRLVVEGGEGDGFLAKILSALQVQAEANFGVGMTLLTGFTFKGGAKLAIELRTHIDLGPVHIDALRLALALVSDQVNLEAGAVFRFDLGPLKAVVENIGIKSSLKFKQGNLGPVDLGVAFKPPNGVGLLIDAGIVKGGGYLFFDFDRQEYAGVLELSFAGIVTVKGIGLITTKMPDGSKGFSLLIIITAEFGTGIQLGFGFTLLGVGGLLGLNRTMNLQPLMDGVRTGSINSIMFPENPVANAPRIIADLRVIFPPYPDRFLIGPMAKLGWGTPTLVSVSMGIIIEISGNIAILGVLKIALPAPEAPLIVIQANFAGAIEFDKQRLYFFAGLFESRIVFLTLEGELGLLVAWGSDANFVVSVGGFHPRFNPPPLPFPSPQRIAVSILNTDIARIRTETYFAVTSNTVQFGARTELMFDVGVARVDGHMAFDALFQFSPFYFVIEISAGVSLKVFGVGLFSIHLQFSLEGPSPFRAHGTGTLSLFFFDVSADFDITWGDSKDTTLPPVQVMPLLRGELEKLESWKAELPANSNLLVSLRKLPDTETAQVLHPLGTLRVSQRAVPLDLKIDKVGSQQPSDANEYKLTAVAGLMKGKDADEQFAKAQFLKMSDADKLSQRAFDPLHGGVTLSSGAQQLGATKLTKRRVRYEQIIIDSNYLSFRRRFMPFTAGFFNHFMKGAAVTKSELSNHHKSQLDPFKDKVKVQEGGFTVAQTADNKAYSSQAAYFASEAQAARFISELVATRPELHESLHVIPQYEASA
jgi:hypothetical protein